MEIAGKNLTSQKHLPFTHKLEWLQGDGQAYIDTKLFGNQDIDIECDFTILDKNTRWFICGYQSNSYRELDIQAGNNNITRRGEKQFGTSILVNEGDFVCKNAKSGCWINGAKVNDWQLGDFQFKTVGTMLVFKTYPGTAYSFGGKIRYFKVWQDEELIMHLVPVRVGEVGCMYDEVSEQLFFNVGQGAFICGPDRGGNG